MEMFGQHALISKAAGRRDVGDCSIVTTHQQALRKFNTALNNVLVRRDTHGLMKGAAEVTLTIADEKG
jgi:hypothetical protein